MLENTLSLIIISDLHCCHSSTEKNGRSTNLYSDLLREPISQHPVEALLKLIREREIKSDILLCPGDLANKMDRQGFISGWDFILEIKHELGSKLLAATLGNHDVDSRKIYDSEVFNIAKGIRKSFPVENEDALPADNEKAIRDFWNDHFCIVENEDLDLVIFNSSYSHSDSESAKSCKIETKILEKMEEKFSKLNNNKSYKIALCHHHPMLHSNLTNKDVDFIDKGDDFLRLLNKYDFQIIIHGHKHNPRLAYGMNNIPVLGAGSFSSLENLNETDSRNVFHKLTLHPKIKKGILESYQYSPIKGWHTDNTTFPSKTGFGYIGEISTLVEQCKDWMISKQKDIAKIETLLKDVPEIQYLIPDQYDKFKTELLRHNIGLTNEFISRQLVD